MSRIRIYPKLATHCVYPYSDNDEFFYRVSDDGSHLEQFVMEEKQWAKSCLPLGWLDQCWGIEFLRDGDRRRVVYTPPSNPVIDIQVIDQ